MSKAGVAARALGFLTLIWPDLESMPTALHQINAIHAVMADIQRNNYFCEQLAASGRPLAFLLRFLVVERPAPHHHFYVHSGALALRLRWCVICVALLHRNGLLQTPPRQHRWLARMRSKCRRRASDAVPPSGRARTIRQEATAGPILSARCIFLPNQRRHSLSILSAPPLATISLHCTVGACNACEPEHAPVRGPVDGEHGAGVARQIAHELECLHTVTSTRQHARRTCASQSLMVESSEAVMMRRESGLHTRRYTGPTWPRSVPRNLRRLQGRAGHAHNTLAGLGIPDLGGLVEAGGGDGAHVGRELDKVDALLVACSAESRWRLGIGAPVMRVMGFLSAMPFHRYSVWSCSDVSRAARGAGLPRWQTRAAPVRRPWQHGTAQPPPPSDPPCLQWMGGCAGAACIVAHQPVRDGQRARTAARSPC